MRKSNSKRLLTKCDPQPFYNNYTININGWELISFAPCNWAEGFVHFCDNLYRHDGQECIAIQPEVVLRERDLVHTLITKMRHLLRTIVANPGYVGASTDYMSVMADFITIMNILYPSQVN